MPLRTISQSQMKGCRKHLAVGYEPENYLLLLESSPGKKCDLWGENELLVLMMTKNFEMLWDRGSTYTDVCVLSLVGE